MELTLTRQELLQVSSTCRKTMRLLPLGKKKQQKVVVGDETGTVQCFGMKKDGVVETIFKTPTGEREVGRIEVAGAGGKSDASGEEPVKIFYASGGTVRGPSRRGFGAWGDRGGRGLRAWSAYRLASASGRVPG